MNPENFPWFAGEWHNGVVVNLLALEPLRIKFNYFKTWIHSSKIVVRQGRRGSETWKLLTVLRVVFS